MKKYSKNYEVSKEKIGEKPHRKKWFSFPHNYGLWYMRDNRNLSGLVGIFVFVSMMAIFFFTSDNIRSSATVESSPRMLESLGDANLEVKKCCLRESDTITCSNVTSDSIEEVQMEINNLAKKDPVATLIFDGLQDSISVIKQNWLENVTMNLSSLTIRKTYMPTINENSFYGGPFTTLNDLLFEDIGNISISKTSFSGLNSLTSLSMRGRSQIIYAEECTLDNLPSLTIIQLQECMTDAQVLKNLTGGFECSLISSMQTLDISQNQFNKLLGYSFSRLPSLISLYAQNSDLSNGLDVDVFRSISPTQIFLTNTQLTTLPEGIFDPYKMKQNSLKLLGNQWNCTCSFQWFQNLYLKSGLFDSNETLICYFNNDEYDLGNFSFCPDETSTMVSTTQTIFTPPLTSETSNDTTPTPNEYKEIQCFPANKTDSKSFKVSDTRTIYLGMKNTEVEFQQINNEAKYKVIVKQPLGDDIVFVYINKDGWILCLSDLGDSFFLERLKFGETYIVCFLEATQHTVSPTNCQSLSVPEEWSMQTWLRNESKLPFIVGTISGALFTLIFPLMCMFFYMKRNPNILYGKENVIVVERKPSNKRQSMEERNYEKPPSFSSWSDGYLTPKHYESVENVHIPCIDQFPPSFFRRPRIRPGYNVVGQKQEEAGPSSDTDIYESVNIFPSPCLNRYINSYNSHNYYNSL
ncbi:hypothetical protein HHI36_006833 [Cryptolaemus montrouzieri]|uniref:Uncharacterized protein n=1 Tax=Cryptolaemus montrouzieri TaxID=559131 RepID=A0ABD2MNN1_9CUCU